MNSLRRKRIAALERWHEDHPIDRILAEPACAADPLYTRWVWRGDRWAPA